MLQQLQCVWNSKLYTLMSAKVEQLMYMLLQCTLEESHVHSLLED